jgi:Uma2 family endonuclease
MIEQDVAIRRHPRGSRWGEDGLYYPAEEERTVPLSDAAICLIFYLLAALRHVLYARHELVYVAADQFIYYVPHDPRHPIAPDVWVCDDVPKEPPRAVFRTWEEEQTPSFVVEISSKESRGEDRGPKFAIYQDVLRCREYLIYDEGLDELLLYRRVDETFRQVEPAPDGRVYSEELNLGFGKEAGLLVRVYTPDGQAVANVEELFDQTETLAGIRRRLEEERSLLATQLEAEQRNSAQERQRAQAERQRAEAERRRAADLAEENERLRAELARLRGEAGE